MYRFMSKHSSTSSDHYVLFLSRSLVTPRHRCVIIREVDAYKDRLLVTVSLLFLFCRQFGNLYLLLMGLKYMSYQQNVSQQYYLLDTLVIN